MRILVQSSSIAEGIVSLFCLFRDIPCCKYSLAKGIVSLYLGVLAQVTASLQKLVKAPD